jgi:hypothetical protein
LSSTMARCMVPRMSATFAMRAHASLMGRKPRTGRS